MLPGRSAKVAHNNSLTVTAAFEKKELVVQLDLSDPPFFSKESYVTRWGGFVITGVRNLEILDLL